MKKRAISLLLIFAMMVVLVPGGLVVSAASNEPANYTTGVSSYEQLTSRLESLKSKYVGTYWTTNGQAANSSGSTSKYYYGIQCKGFAGYIFNDLFCGGYIGAYDSSKYYIPSPNGATLVDKSWGFSSTDTITVKNILSRGSVGDLIQVRRRGKTYGHTMILGGLDDSGIWIFDCNSDGKCGVKYYHQDWATFASKNTGMSLYHSTRYPKKEPHIRDTSYPTEFKATAKAKQYAQSESHGSVGNHWVDQNDSCTIHEVYTDGCCLVTYPAGNSTATYYFKISNFEWNRTVAPTEASISVNKTEFKAGETVTFSFGGNNGTTGYTIGIDKDGGRVVTKEVGSSFSISTLEPGNYSAYVTAYNSAGGHDSGRVSFKINPKYENVGDDFYAVLFMNSAWKPITNVDGNIQIQKELGNSSQVWRIKRQSDGSYYIISAKDGKYLDVYGGTYANGTNVQTFTGNGQDNQKWYFVAENGGYSLRPKSNNTYANYVLDVNGGISNDGQNVQLWEYNGTNAQIFYLYKPSGVALKSTTLSAAAGTSETNTKFSWTHVYGRTGYDLKLWNGKYWEGDPYYTEWGIQDLSYSKKLPAGYYEGYVDASHALDCKMSNVVCFEVSPVVHVGRSGNSYQFTWDKVLSASSYRLIATNVDTARGAFIKNFGENELSYTTDLEPANYQVRVVAFFSTPYQPSDSSSSVSSITSERVQFKAEDLTYTVSYNANGGTGAPAAQTKTHGKTLTLSSVVPVREGYEFLGWSANKNAVTAEYKAGAAFTENKNTPLYAVWKVKTPLTIVTQPKSVVVKPGQRVTFRCVAKGDGLSYQWYFKKKGASSWTKWKTLSEFSCVASETWNGFRAYCVVKDKYGVSLPSNVMTVTVQSVSITSQPKSAAIVSGDTASFSVAAKGDGLTYQWYFKKKDASSWSKWKTAASFTCKTDDTWDGFQAYCVVTDMYESTAKSNTMTLTLKTPLSISTQPKSATIASGDTAKFNIAAKGDGVTYQWYFKKKGASSWTKWKTAASFTCKTDSTWNGFQAYCVVTDKYGETKNSNTMTLTLKTPLTITTQPKSAAIASGDTAKFNIAAKGDGVTYQWYFKKKGASSWTKWKTAASFTCKTDSTWNGFQAYCVVTDKYGATKNSNTMTLTLKTPLTITTQPKSATITSGGTAKFNIAAKGDGVTYQWYFKKKGASSWTKWKTAASFTCKTDSTWNGFQAYCVVTDKYGETKKSNTMTLTVKTPLSITTQPKDVTMQSGNAAKFSVTAKGDGLSYQWYFKKNGASSWTKWKTTASFTCKTDSTWDGFRAYCVVTDQYGSTVKSDVMTLTLD